MHRSEVADEKKRFIEIVEVIFVTHEEFEKAVNYWKDKQQTDIRISEIIW